tara:strand:- start:2 stop:1093 length:1092 start_codon:yes stop_codon:yes gene_type:complete
MNYTVSVNLAGHNSSICILKDGDIELFIEEERLSRWKRDNRIPLRIIEVIKDYTTYIDTLVLMNFGYDYMIDYVKNHISKEGITVNDVVRDDIGYHHHLSHAASGFYCSGFEEAICLVMDGSGGTFMFNDKSMNETTSIYHAKYPAVFDVKYKRFNYIVEQWDTFNFIEDVTKTVGDEFGCPVDIEYQHDVGNMYSAVCKSMGFGELNEGKLMGLSSYGKPNSNLPDILCDGLTNMQLVKPNRQMTVSLEDKEDWAYAAQKAAEKMIVERVDYIVDNFDCKNLVFSGGCSLNILANSEIKKKYPELNVFVDPIATDANQSLGAAKYAYHMETNDTKIRKLDTIYLGRQYEINTLRKEITNFLK